MIKKLIYILLFLVAIASGIGFYVYNLIMQNDLIFEGKKTSITIEKPVPFSELGSFLQEKGIIKDKKAIDLFIKIKGYDNLVLNEGKITIKKEWNNKDLVNQIKLMRNQKKIVSLTFGSVRKLEDLAGKIAHQIEMDSLQLINYLNLPEVHKKYGFTAHTFPTLFIPNTYDVYYNITPEEFVAKMAKEYKKFWNKERQAKAKELQLSQSEVTILASIVYEEQKVRFDEQAKIAGLYLNRLKNNWLLQADPTLKFALNDPARKRLYFKDFDIESPYNTYRNAGLPPGPICIPEPRTIDAVLNYEKHDFFYMCAKPEYSGYHNFAKTNKQHEANARAYHRWLEKEKIR